MRANFDNGHGIIIDLVCRRGFICWGGRGDFDFAQSPFYGSTQSPYYEFD